MLTFILAVLGFLLARSLWDAVKHFAEMHKELPLVWLVKTLGIVIGLGLLIGGFGMFVLVGLSAR